MAFFKKKLHLYLSLFWLTIALFCFWATFSCVQGFKLLALNSDITRCGAQDTLCNAGMEPGLGECQASTLPIVPWSLIFLFKRPSSPFTEIIRASTYCWRLAFLASLCTSRSPVSPSNSPKASKMSRYQYQRQGGDMFVTWPARLPPQPSVSAENEADQGTLPLVHPTTLPPVLLALEDDSFFFLFLRDVNDLRSWYSSTYERSKSISKWCTS